jgi:hypothetical protein
MFLYFVQRKGWLGNRHDFIGQFWQAYRCQRTRGDTFYHDWLSVLFFEAFNKKFNNGHPYLPREIQGVLRRVPYLNGGLFIENKLDRAFKVRIRDAFFGQLFDEFAGSTRAFSNVTTSQLPNLRRLISRWRLILS